MGSTLTRLPEPHMDTPWDPSLTPPLPLLLQVHALVAPYATMAQCASSSRAGPRDGCGSRVFETPTSPGPICIKVACHFCPWWPSMHTMHGATATSAEFCTYGASVVVFFGLLVSRSGPYLGGQGLFTFCTQADLA